MKLNPKSETLNPKRPDNKRELSQGKGKQLLSLSSANLKQYDLEGRTFKFASDCRDFITGLPRNLSNLEYSKQLIRSSGSVAANYIEANEALSKKDFIMRIKICRKEAKESRLWLRLVLVRNMMKKTQQDLIRESTELMKIFGAILEKSK